MLWTLQSRNTIAAHGAHLATPRFVLICMAWSGLAPQCTFTAKARLWMLGVLFAGKTRTIRVAADHQNAIGTLNGIWCTQFMGVPNWNVLSNPFQAGIRNVLNIAVLF